MAPYFEHTRERYRDCERMLQASNPNAVVPVIPLSFYREKKTPQVGLSVVSFGSTAKCSLTNL